MKYVKRKMHIMPVLMVVATVFTLCACGKKEVETKNEFPTTLENIASEIVASNENLSLEWDSEKYCVLLKQKNTEKVWSTIPYDFYKTGANDEDMSSPIYIEYIDSHSLIGVVSKGYSDSISLGRVASRQIENGIEVTYYFDNAEIAVPVQYCLREDALTVTVDFEHVKENNYQLLSVSVSPFLCSAKNNVEDSYIVVPSGSGALMYLDERNEGTRNWSGEIYGEDKTRLLPEKISKDELVKVPIFGIKEGDEALLAVVEEGREAAVISAVAGDSRTKYSNAYVSFYARGYDILESTQSWSTRDVYRTEEKISANKSTVAFYPLSNDEANYMGMASLYQEQLKDLGMSLNDKEEEIYALYFSGGAQIKELFVGVPINKTNALTTYSDVQNITCQILEDTGNSPVIQLKGFGYSGLDIGEVAGGYGFSKVFGSEAQRLKLEEYCSDNNISMYMDFDLLYFSEGGSGFNTLIGAAKSASMRKATQYYNHKSLWNYDKNEGAYYLIKREDIQKAVDKLKKFTDEENIKGISLSTLGQIAYSDYSNEKYSLRGDCIVDTQRYLEQLKQSGKKVATQSSNDYAAYLSDSIFNVPMDGGQYLSLDADIPLYQMIFKGYVPMYSTAINTTSNFNRALMLAVQSGVYPGFSLVSSYDEVFSQTVHDDLHQSSYRGNQNNILDAILKCKSFYMAIQDETIVDYEFISDVVTKTSFSNGVVVYANHSNESVETPLGTLDAYGFTYKKMEVE